MGAWIETPINGIICHIYTVAPLVGAWIETLHKLYITTKDFFVAPLVGAWIETQYVHLRYLQILVAPLVGAWIETFYPLQLK